jgi:hypothetical protein
MRLLGFELTLRARRLPPPPPSRIVIPLVRLRDVPARSYSVPAETVGVVEDTTDVGHFISWSTGGSSGPILDEDLVRLGEVSVSLKGAGGEP